MIVVFWRGCQLTNNRQLMLWFPVSLQKIRNSLFSFYIKYSKIAPKIFLPHRIYPRGDFAVVYFIVVALAAFGALSMMWSLLGWLLPAGEGCALVCYGEPDEGILSRYLWLRGMGLLRCPLLAVVPPDASLSNETENCTREALLARLEWERKRVHGTGNGDSPGCH